MMIRLEQSGVRESGEKRGRSERNKNTTQIEKTLAKMANKRIVRRSDWRVRKVADQQSASLQRLIPILYVVVQP